MIDCPNYNSITKYVAQCSVIQSSGIQYIPSEKRSGCPCHACLKQQSGVPTLESPTQAIVEFVKLGQMNYPTYAEQGKSLVKAILTDVFRGFPNVPSGEIDVRIKICESNKCQLFEPVERRCKGCGCFIDKKATYNAEQCPVGAWPELPKEIQNNVISRCGSCGNR